MYLPLSGQIKKRRRDLSDRGDLLAVSRPIVPRAPSLELYVLPIGGGQLINFFNQWS
jgi:hypothetical protein